MHLSRWLRGLTCWSVAARFLWLRVRIPPGSWISVSCDCCVLLGRGLRRADHSSRGVLPSVVSVTECDRESSTVRRPWPTRGFRAMVNKNTTHAPIPVAARSKACVCGRSLDGIVGSNPAYGDACLSVVSVVCFVGTSFYPSSSWLKDL